MYGIIENLVQILVHLTRWRMQQGIVTCLRCVGISMHIWTPKLRSHQLRFSPSLAHFQADSIHHYYGLVLIHILDKGKEQAQTRFRAINIRGVPVISSKNSHAPKASSFLSLVLPIEQFRSRHGWAERAWENGIYHAGFSATRLGLGWSMLIWWYPLLLLAYDCYNLD